MCERQVVGESVELLAEGADRFRVLTPFGFDDGDCFVVVLRRQEGRWFLTDEGHPFFHRSDEFEESDLRSGSGARRIAAALARFGVEDRGGEFRLEIPERRSGEALRTFVGAIGVVGVIGAVAEIAGRSWARFPAARPADTAGPGPVPGRGQAGPRAGSPGREFGREFVREFAAARCPAGFSRVRRAASARRREGGGGFGSPCRGDRRSARAPSAPGSEIWVDHIH